MDVRSLTEEAGTTRRPSRGPILVLIGSALVLCLASGGNGLADPA